MRKTYEDICLLDFNLALALGEENIVERSDGYSSPEHYGFDFSTNSGTSSEKDSTIAMDGVTVTMPKQSGTSSSSSKRIVVPDVYSDIYSVGATLRHLLTGKRLATHATDIVTLSDKEFIP